MALVETPRSVTYLIGPTHTLLLYVPVRGVQHISLEEGNRVVLTCVGGRDSYAVFEAAKDDAAAVLYAGEQAGGSCSVPPSKEHLVRIHVQTGPSVGSHLCLNGR